MRRRTALIGLLALGLGLGACAHFPGSDPLIIDVAGIEPLPGEGLELRLAVSLRIQNPNDTPIEYTGVALDVDLNGRRLASGVSGDTGTVPRYGETVLTLPVTISAFNVARQLMGLVNGADTDRVDYRVQGKLDAGFFGTHRFADEGAFDLNLRR